jgi:hypothetical protein
MAEKFTIVVLVIWATLATAAATWAIFQLTFERSMSRMTEEWRENDRKFYRGWEDVWFGQLEEVNQRNQFGERVEEHDTQ